MNEYHDCQRRDFMLMIRLMMGFFVVELLTDATIAFGLTTMKIGDGLAHDAFMVFFGVAAGIFRGMLPSISLPPSHNSIK
jgi:hypothetical protein